MAVNKNDEALVEIGNALFEELGFYAASNSIKPLYVANGLFREVTGTTCDISDIYDWVRAENAKKSLSSKEILEQYASIIIQREGDEATIDELKEIRYYLEKLFNPDSNIQSGDTFSVPNISSIWQVRSYVQGEERVGGFLFKILNGKVDGKNSKAIEVIEKALKNDDDDITRTIKPIIAGKSDSERKYRRDISVEEIDYTIAPDTILTVRRGFDCLAENCMDNSGKMSEDSLMVLRRMTSYSMFAVFFYLSDINHTKYDDKKVPLLIDADTGLGAIVNASSKCLIECKKAVERFTTNFVKEWLLEAKLISDVNNKAKCHHYLSEDINVTDDVRLELCLQFENNCKNGDSPLLATAKAIQYALYTVTYKDTTPSDFCSVIGTRAGLVGPGGNTNYRRLLVNRFLLETIILSALTDEQLENGVEFKALGTILRDKYNIIIGTDIDKDYEMLDEFGITKNTPEDLRGALSANAQEIADKIISLGLGKRYADGVTIIGRGL